MTQSLRERLAAKAVRRSSIQVPLGDDPSAALEELQSAEVELGMIPDDPDNEKRRVAAKLKRDKVRESYNEQFAEVWIKAMPRADYHALCEEFDSEDDGVDWDRLLPAILAESCEDESLRDAEFWAGEFTSDRWPEGDFLHVQQVVLNLNMQTPRPLLGKG